MQKVLLLAGGVTMFGYMLLQNVFAHETTVLVRSGEKIPPRFIAHLTKLQWNGQPVFLLENTSNQNLQHFMVSSWSNENLPILWIGRLPYPKLDTSSMPLQNPPYDLPAATDLLFIAPAQDNLQFSVSWLKHGISHYENLRVSKER